MRIWVTGGSGFVARRLVPRLERAGHEVVATDRDVDVADAGAMDAAARRIAPEAVIHLAALSSVATSWREPGNVYRVNFLGAVALLRVVEARCPAARVLLVSSSDIYGSAAPGATPFVESDPLCPASPYARTKAAAELLGADAARRGLDVVRVRAFSHTGAGQSDQFVASSFARQIAEIAAGRGKDGAQLQVGNLDSVRDLLDVDDVVEAYVGLLDPSVPTDVYNVARGEGVEIRTILETLLEISGVKPEIVPDPRRMRPTSWSVGDASKLHGVTGWAPRIPLAETLRGLLDDWRRRIAGGESASVSAS
ncbi:MAG: GDP-mannose 4,6-dehydratase [Proteobacteria bacterium]|nr:GDP-mannose 4,6-dehydratase [Pseudomonadota bacterium]